MFRRPGKRIAGHDCVSLRRAGLVFPRFRPASRPLCYPPRQTQDERQTAPGSAPGGPTSHAPVTCPGSRKPCRALLRCGPNLSPLVSKAGHKKVTYVLAPIRVPRGALLFLCTVWGRHTRLGKAETRKLHRGITQSLGYTAASPEGRGSTGEQPRKWCVVLPATFLGDLRFLVRVPLRHQYIAYSVHNRKRSFQGDPV